MEFFNESGAAGSGALLRKPLERPKPKRRRPTSETAVQRVWGQQELRDPGKRIKTQREH